MKVLDMAYNKDSRRRRPAAAEHIASDNSSSSKDPSMRATTKGGSNEVVKVRMRLLTSVNVSAVTSLCVTRIT